MATICFVSYEIYPTTPGGCGVLLRNAAELLLARGHRIVFLLDVPHSDFKRFQEHDRLQMPNAEHCWAYEVQALVGERAGSEHDVTSTFAHRSLRFALALRRVQEHESLDYVEFFDYCGPAYYALATRLFEPSGVPTAAPVIGIRLHGSIELIDEVGATHDVNRDRYRLYALERGAFRLADAILAPSRSYYEATAAQRYGLPAERVAVSQSPRQDFPRVTQRPALDRHFRILFLGRIYHLKGVDQLVHAALLLLRRRPQLRCTFDLIGLDSAESPFGTSSIAYLRAQIPPALRPRFEFPGHVERAAIVRRLDETLFAVFPNRFESFCYALHEVYDAGVPVIINNLPAFRAFFEHERNALFYDGTTEGLLAAMECLLDDDALRERITRPYAVATEPLGVFYDHPRPLGAPAPDVTTPTVLVVVLAPKGLESAAETLGDLAAQTAPPAKIVCLLPAGDEADTIVPWLGRPWRVVDPHGTPQATVDFLTRDALVTLWAGDRAAPDWLARCTAALQRWPAAAFTGTWAQRGGQLVPSFLDVAPDLHPFDHGGELTRVLLRTQPGRLAVDLLDANLGALGELGALWRAIGRWGPGVLLPEPLLELIDDRQPLDPVLFHYLLLSAGRALPDGWQRAAGLLATRVTGHDSTNTAAYAELLELRRNLRRPGFYMRKAAQKLLGRLRGNRG
ncbi:MAG: glycosyltransferase family 4 protein [Phycisphaerales bacterium]|nr:glycosyltransferase family 4 protein [Phycisphaerales bacterium]